MKNESFCGGLLHTTNCLHEKKHRSKHHPHFHRFTQTQNQYLIFEKCIKSIINLQEIVFTLNVFVFSEIIKKVKRPRFAGKSSSRSFCSQRNRLNYV